MNTRESLFRGLKADGSNEWVYGNLNQLQDGVFILEKDSFGVISEPDYHSSGMGCGLEDRNITDRYDAMEHGWERAIERQFELLPCFIEVTPETVGQFTGLTDKNGTRIFEGDKFGIESKDVVVVYWDKHSVQFRLIGDEVSLHMRNIFEKKSKLIGNIHQK